MMITENELDVRPFTSGDERIVQRWRDKFPFKDGSEGCEVELGDVYSDDNHFLVCLKNDKRAIGSFYLREIEPGRSSEVVLAIGDFAYMNKVVFRAMFNRVAQYLKELYPKGKCLFLLDVKSVLQLMKGNER